MKKLITALILALMGTHAAADAAETGEPRLIACFKEVKVGAQYSVKKVLVKKAERKYIKRGDDIRLMEYPAIYREDKTLIKPAHVVMKEVVCKD